MSTVQGISKTYRDIEPLVPVSPQQVESARRSLEVVAGEDQSALTEVLDMLGIGEGWQESWPGPVYALPGL